MADVGVRKNILILARTFVSNTIIFLQTKTVHAGTDPADEDEYYSDDEGIHKPTPEFSQDALLAFLEKVEPVFNEHLRAN